MNERELLEMKIRVGNIFYAAMFGYTFPEGYYGGCK